MTEAVIYAEIILSDVDIEYGRARLDTMSIVYNFVNYFTTGFILILFIKLSQHDWIKIFRKHRESMAFAQASEEGAGEVRSDAPHNNTRASEGDQARNSTIESSDGVPQFIEIG